MIVGHEKPSLSELNHYGVLGMKWGQRRQAGATQIKAARRRLKKESTAYRKESKKLSGMAEGSAQRKSLEAKLNKRHQAYLRNPDRVIATRMTRGEKIASVLFTSGGPIGIAATVGSIAGTSIASRRIEYKQDRGDYDKMPAGKKPNKRLGFQRGRSALLIGAALAPAAIKVAGMVVMPRIAAKAAANRAAARAAARGPKAIASLASKAKYARKARGVFKVTTL